METMKDDMNDRKNDYRLDFGDDADVTPASDPAFDAWVSGVAPSVNAPPATPAGDMWAAIQAAQRTAGDANAGVVPGVRPLRRTRWIIPAAIAAALIIGVGIGRFGMRGANETARPPVAVAPEQPGPTHSTRQDVAANTPVVPGTHTSPARPADASRVRAPSPTAPTERDPSRLYRLAAVQTLTQAEALLTSYKSAGAAGRTDPSMRQLGTWGRDVLSSTRLLLDSPAGDDPELRQLLNDVELVLVQIIQLSGAPLDANDRALIDRALRDHNLLPRIRTAVPAGAAGTA
jgi:hypothetical protein